MECTVCVPYTIVLTTFIDSLYVLFAITYSLLKCTYLVLSQPNILLLTIGYFYVTTLDFALINLDRKKTKVIKLALEANLN